MKVTDKFLTPNPYSRPQKKLKGVKGLVIHYVGNPNSSAMANRNYFDNLKNQSATYASTQYIVGLDGEIIKMMPEDEMAYHVGSKTYKDKAIQKLGSYPNDSTLGIECCHLDSKGKMPQKTWDSLVELSVDICKRHKLNPLTDLWIHYEVTGKHCHAWFVNYPADWTKFKNEVNQKLNGSNKEEYKVIKTKIELNGQVKEVDTINVDGFNYIKLRDLQDTKIKVSYDDAKKLPIVGVEKSCCCSCGK